MKTSRCITHYLVPLACLLPVLLLPDAVWAGSFSDTFTTTSTTSNGSSNSIEQVMCNLVLIMTGTTGKAIATVGIVGVGVGALFGKVSWNTAMLATLSVGLIFGAASIVGDLGGGPGFALILGSPGLSSGDGGIVGSQTKPSGGLGAGGSDSGTCSSGGLSSH